MTPYYCDKKYSKRKMKYKILNYEIKMKRTNRHNRGDKMILFSTPKLVQHMFQEKFLVSEEEMIDIISTGTSGKIVVMGTTVYDLSVDSKISMTGKELVQKIMEPTGINIVF